MRLNPSVATITAMNNPKAKVAYKKPSKRNPLKDVFTDAARRAGSIDVGKLEGKIVDACRG